MKNKRCIKRKVTSWIMLLSVLFSTMASPTITLAEEVGSQFKTEKIDKKNVEEEVVTKSTETKENQSPETIKEDVTKEETLDSTAKANDSPEVPDVSMNFPVQQEEEENTDKNSDEETESVDMERINQLAKRPLTEKYDTTGLTNVEIEQLGLAIFGEVQPEGTKTTMENDLGEKVNIPFKINNIQTFAIGTSSSFNMSYTLTGFGVTNTYPKMAHHYMDGKYSYCMDPTYIFYPGSQYTGNTMDISNQTYKNVNDVLNFGAKDGSDEVAAGYTQLLVWARIGWDVSAVGGIGTLSGFKAYQAEVENKMQKWYAKPSFENQTVNLRVGESVTLTDSNNGINEMTITGNTTGTQVTKTGNKITIKATAATNTNGNIVFKKDTPLSDTPLIWVSPGSQSNVTGGKLDPSSILSTVKVNIIKQGDFVLQKVNDAGTPMAGVTFNLTYNGKTVSKTTDKDGKISISDLDVGTVVAYEETKTIAGHYIDAATSKGSVTIKEGTNSIKVTNPRFANLTLVKKNDKGKALEGVTFKLTYNEKDYSVKTDEDGKIQVLNTLKNNTKVEWEETATIKGHYIDPENSKGSIVVKSGENTINVNNPTLNFGMDSQAGNTDGQQFINPSKGQKLVDQVMVEAHQAPANAKLRLTTDFVEFGTGKQLGEKSLKQVTEFEAKQAKFVKAINLDFDATNLHGKKGVFTNVLEYYNPSTKEWEEVARHDDLKNEAEAIQIVKPEIHTELFFYDQNNKETKLTDPLKKVKGYDRVFFKNLIAGETYVFDLAMMNRETGKEFTDPSGKPVTGTLTVVAGKDGKVTSTINAKEYYENLAKEEAGKDKEAEVGKDTENEATDKEEATETPEVKAAEKVEEETNTGNEAEQTEEPTEYTPLVEVELLTGYVDVPFITNLSAAKGKIMVAYEKLSHNDTPIAHEKDIKNEKQTGNVRNPKIGTKALVNGKTEVTTDGKVTLTDEISFYDLTPNVEYEAKLVWMDARTKKPVVIDGKELTTTIKFTPKESNGSVIVKIEDVSIQQLFGNDSKFSLVAFEEVLSNDEKIAEHKDINDKGQTITITKPATPVTPSKTVGTLPQTSGMLTNKYVWIAALALVAGAIFLLKNRKEGQEK